MKSTTSHHAPPVDEVTVLVVDDEEAFHDLLADAILAGHGYHVLHAYSGGQCVELLAQHRVDVVVLDLNLPDGNGFRVLEDMREERDRAVPIVVSAYADPKSIQRAHDAGAWMVLDKRFEDYRWLPRYITQAIEQRKRQAARKSRRRPQGGQAAGNAGKPESLEQGQRLLRAAELDAFDRLERSASLPMRSLLRQLRNAAERPAPVFLQGEPGSDRELLARYLHACSKRSHAPFVAAVAIPGRGLASALGPASPESLLATAAKGTLFIDQIHQLDPEWQHLLLEVLSETGQAQGANAEEPAPVAGTRIVAAASTPFGKEGVWDGLHTRIRESLSDLQLVIPPLRERLTDLANELEFLLEHTAATLGVEPPRPSPALITALSRYGFPGNEHELRAMVVLACVRKPGARLGPRDMLPPDAPAPSET